MLTQHSQKRIGRFPWFSFHLFMISKLEIKMAGTCPISTEW
jgi:hypothetical protein